MLVLSLVLACGPQESASVSESGSSSDAGSTSATGGSTGTTDATTDATTDPTTTEATTGTASSGSSGTTADPTGGPVCTLPPLPEEVLPDLGFDVFGNDFEMQPGELRSLAVGRIECCYALDPVDACIAYSVTPDDGGASVGPETGLLTISQDAKPGSVYTVTADVEAGRAVLMATVTVWTPESHPLVGYWHEVAQIPCDNGPEVPPAKPIQELWFRANGEVSVTWTPFEIYRDYWADYVFDLVTGDLAITDPQGNYVPVDVDGVGTFVLEGNDLVLKDMWLGSPQDVPGTPNCGHRFTR